MAANTGADATSDATIDAAVAMGCVSAEDMAAAMRAHAKVEQRHQRAAAALAAARAQLAESEAIPHAVQGIGRDFEKATTALQLGEYAVLNLRGEMKGWTMNCWGAEPLSSIFSMLCDDTALPPLLVLTDGSDAGVDAQFNPARAQIQQRKAEAGEELERLAQLQQRLKTQRGTIGALALLHSQYREAMLRLLQGKFLPPPSLTCPFYPPQLAFKTPRIVLKTSLMRIHAHRSRSVVAK